MLVKELRAPRRRRRRRRHPAATIPRGFRQTGSRHRNPRASRLAYWSREICVVEDDERFNPSRKFSSRFSYFSSVSSLCKVVTGGKKSVQKRLFPSLRISSEEENSSKRNERTPLDVARAFRPKKSYTEEDR